MLTKWNKYFVTLLMLAYTSQSFAALLMPCPMEGIPTAESMHPEMGHDIHVMAGDHAMMGHSMARDGASFDAATIAAPPADGHDKFDCCDAMGHCLMGNCMIHGASNDVVHALDDAASKAVYSDHLKSPSHLTSIHFRPPIFA